MKLQEIITYLDALPPALQIPVGFANPHPCHSIGTDIAFTPAYNVTIASMAFACRKAFTVVLTNPKTRESVPVRQTTDCWLGRGRDQPGNLLIEPILLDTLTRYPTFKDTLL